MVARPGQMAECGNDIGEVVGYVDGDTAVGSGDVERHGFLAHDRHLGVHLERIVRADLAAEAVLQRRDDAAAVGVVLGVRGCQQHHVEWQADLVATDLDVTLFQHVEHADLDALGEVGQLVDREDAAVGARHEAVVKGEFVGQVATLGHLDRVDLADQVGDRRVGRGQLLAEPLAAMHPVDRRVVAEFLDQIASVFRNGVVRIVIDLATCDDRHPLVEQPGERTDHARLGLTALAEEDHVVTRQQRVLELRHHRVFVAGYSFEERFAGRDLLDGVLAHLLLDGSRHPPRSSKLPQRRRLRSVRVSHVANLPRAARW